MLGTRDKMARHVSPNPLSQGEREKVSLRRMPSFLRDVLRGDFSREDGHDLIDRMHECAFSIGFLLVGDECRWPGARGCRCEVISGVMPAQLHCLMSRVVSVFQVLLFSSCGFGQDFALLHLQIAFVGSWMFSGAWSSVGWPIQWFGGSSWLKFDHPQLPICRYQIIQAWQLDEYGEENDGHRDVLSVLGVSVAHEANTQELALSRRHLPAST
ncbi:hypothetical protein B0T11DRAFT_86957 [Plectosphaerella cucumerina]|uniref:Uncharacterized protein n=1 Tax=Plectosphaerella cucumerina TaxID=40658 RepID=A0A8K0X5E2_9PEZI|nr:hypothetical protein B0T11DRAFT_86957 [Plectosphaerella cucumerina]